MLCCKKHLLYQHHSNGGRSHFDQFYERSKNGISSSKTDFQLINNSCHPEFISGSIVISSMKSSRQNFGDQVQNGITFPAHSLNLFTVSSRGSWLHYSRKFN